MNINLGIWDKLTKLTIFCLFILGVVCVAVLYLPLIHQNEQMRKDLLKLETKIKAGQERERELRTAYDSARTNPKTIARLNREHRHYWKPGETVIRVEEPSPRR